MNCESTVVEQDLSLSNPSSQDGVTDNTALSHLSEAGLLHNLVIRFQRKQIYVSFRGFFSFLQLYTAFVLIATNPFERLPIYGPDVIKQLVGEVGRFEMGVSIGMVKSLQAKSFKPSNLFNITALKMKQKIVLHRSVILFYINSYFLITVVDKYSKFVL